MARARSARGGSGKSDAAEQRKRLKIVTPEFRGSFVTLWTPRALDDDGEPEYSMVMVLPKDDEFWDQLRGRMELAMKKKWGKVLPEKKLKHFPIRDGDETEYEEWEDHFYAPLKSKEKPGIVAEDLEPIVDRGEVYSGAWFRASIRPYAWGPGRYGQGVSLQLDNVMKVRDDEPFSGKGQAMDDFADYVDGDEDDDGEDWE